MNNAGIQTVASCCSHNKRPGAISLADGRELRLFLSYESGRECDSLYPIDINGKKVEKPRRFCRNCGTDITDKHPNAKFCSNKGSGNCKDKFWNRNNPRGIYARVSDTEEELDEWEAYLNTVHPFSEEAING